MARILTSRLRDRVAVRHDDRLDRCIASGWQLRRSCTDGHGRGICPACARPVRLRTERPLGQRAWVVEAHQAA